MVVLGIETSCDETAVAVLQDGVVRSNLVASQVRLHAAYGGVVPELAARAHLQRLPGLARLALKEAGVEPAGLDVVAATRGPGLPTALRVGWCFAQAVAFSLDRPLHAIHHHQGHLYSPWFEGQPLRWNPEAFEPHVALVVSGGHTLLVDVPAEGQHQVLGGTIDDAAGECFDKTAKLIGLPYPGGPELDRLAEEGDPESHYFPRPLLHEANDDFSFSGLKTSVRYHLRDHPEILEDGRRLRDLCAAVRAAIVEVLVTKTIRAARRLGRGTVSASGGVSCNRALRRELAAACRHHGLRLRLVQPALATDNAAMIAAVGWRQQLRGVPPAPWSWEAHPGWPLEAVTPSPQTIGS